MFLRMLCILRRVGEEGDIVGYDGFDDHCPHGDHDLSWHYHHNYYPVLHGDMLVDDSLVREEP